MQINQFRALLCFYIMGLTGCSKIGHPSDMYHSELFGHVSKPKLIKRSDCSYVEQSVLCITERYPHYGPQKVASLVSVAVGYQLTAEMVEKIMLESRLKTNEQSQVVILLEVLVNPNHGNSGKQTRASEIQGNDRSSVSVVNPSCGNQENVNQEIPLPIGIATSRAFKPLIAPFPLPGRRTDKEVLAAEALLQLSQG